MRLSIWIAAFGAGVSFACGSGPGGSSGPGSDGSADGGRQDYNLDAGVDGVATPVPNSGPFRPAIVFVNGLVNGVVSQALTLTDVRICIEGVTPYALPDDRPMPLANYPGVGLGQGIDLGAIAGLPSSTVTVDVFNALDLANDAAWTTQRLDCTSIACSTDAGAACREHASLHVSLQAAVNLVVLTDTVQGVSLGSASLDGNYAGSPGSIQAQVANFAGWHDTESAVADFGVLAQRTSTTVLTTNLGGGVASPTSTLAPQSYEQQGVWVAELSADGGVMDSFGQSLGSIQWVSDPTTAPAPFYDVRENFALVLAGDPNDRLLATNGRDPSYDGRALHLVAVPFAAGKPPQ